MKFFKGKTMIKVFSLILTVGLLFAIIGCSDNSNDIDDPTEPTVNVTGVTIQSEDDAITITTKDGTLQFSSAVTPSNATDKSVTWSVVNGTGTATIDQNGLLTAVTDGTVTVKVNSVNNPDYGVSKVVTISNQDIDEMIAVTSIAMQSPGSITTIDTFEGTLQLSATVMPTDATDKSVTWSVTDGTGSATINQSGLLTAVSDGTVTVKVTSNDVATMNDELIITISNQEVDTTDPLMAIDLGTADDFVILSKTGISTTGTTAIVGNIGISPATASYITGFDLIMDGSGEFSTSALISGMVYAADYQTPTPAYLTTAIADMLLAYDDGAGRTADFTELYTGNLSGQTLTTGVYKWSGDVLINSDLTLDGSSTDVMIFQIAGTLTMAADVNITLTGGMLPENIFWVVADTVALGSNAAFQGVILAKTNVSMGTGSSIVGMIYAQTSVALDATAVTKA